MATPAACSKPPSRRPLSGRTRRPAGGTAVALLLLAATLGGCGDGGRPAAVGPAFTAREAAQDPAQWVDPRIGSFPPGFTNPGAAAPHGMVTAGPDTEGPLNYGGYSAQNLLITGFSQTHMSAGVPQGGQIPLLPVTGMPATGGDLAQYGWPNPTPLYASAFDRSSEITEPGYYRVALLRYPVTVEITATPRAAFYRLAFGDDQPAGVLLHLSRDLKGRHPAAATLATDGVLSGRVTTASPEHSVHFALRADRPFTLTDRDGRPLAADEIVTGDDLLLILRPETAGELQLKLGLSYVDSAGARSNLDREIPHWDFDAVRTQTRERWNRELGRIQVDGGRADRRRAFYTALYRTLKFPSLLSDVDGRYRMEETVRQDPGRPRYTQFSLWDSYRGHSALLAEIIPERFRDMVLSMVEYAEVTGQLPRWQLANRDPGYMSGDPAVMYVAEAWCRGLLSPAQRDRAWAALQATVARRDADLELGYKPAPQPESPLAVLEGGPRDAGTTLEYGLADFALAAMAATRGDEIERERRQSMALNYRNLLDSETGWIRPRDADGGWISPFAPELSYGFQEGTSWQYSWLAMHDYAGLIAGMSAVADVERRLDLFFGFPLNLVPQAWPALQNQITAFGLLYYGNQFAPGNEHDLQTPYVYHYLGLAWKSQIAARAATSIYTDQPNGLPGNDDLGALSGWLVWNMLGLYPVNPGLPVYLIGRPEFPGATLHRPTGALRIEAAGAPSAFVTGASQDGEALDGAWLKPGRGTTRLHLRTDPLPDTAWGRSPPPSLSTHALEAFGCRAQ